MIGAISSSGQNISMTGRLYNTLVESSAKVMSGIANTKIAQNEAEKLGKNKHASNIISNVASVVLTLFLLNDIVQSKDIPKENKPYLLINTALVTIVAAFASLAVDSATDNPVEELKKAFMAENFGFSKAQINQVLEYANEYRRTGEIMDEPVHAFAKNNFGLDDGSVHKVFDAAKKRKMQRETAINCALNNVFGIKKKKTAKYERALLHEFADYAETRSLPDKTVFDRQKTLVLYEKILKSEAIDDISKSIGIDKAAFEGVDKFRHQMKMFDDFSRGVSKIKSNTIFSFVVRFGIPLLSVPVTTWVLDFAKNINKDKNNNKIDVNA